MAYAFGFVSAVCLVIAALSGQFARLMVRAHRRYIGGLK
ncbi:hypothetical protein ABIC60_002686 [Phyllobacterium ifriqiyense]